jgi:hypothetical protein
MTTTNEVKLPELPRGEYRSNGEICADWQYTFTDDEMRDYAKQYGTLCYEAGLAAGRGQAGRHDIDGAFKAWVAQLPKGAQTNILEAAERSESLTKQGFEYAYSAALKQSLAQPAQAAVPEGWKLKITNKEQIELLRNALQYIRHVIDQGPWWIDLPDRGGFDVKLIDEALTATASPQTPNPQEPQQCKSNP